MVPEGPLADVREGQDAPKSRRLDMIVCERVTESQMVAVAQLVEHQARLAEMPGSNPASHVFRIFRSCWSSGRIVNVLGLGTPETRYCHINRNNGTR